MSISEVQKVNFIRNCQSEAFLLNEILIPMFSNIGSYKVTKTHGTDEKGKDIVLSYETPLKKRNYIGVIVKNESITNAASCRDKEVVASVANQIVMCLTSGFNSIIENRNVSFNEILVITSKDVTNSARDELVKIANEHRFNNITFWETQDIVDQVNQYLPDIYFTSSGSLSKYFHILKERCETMNELKKISIYRGGDRRLSDIYIEPKLFSRKEIVANGKTNTEHQEIYFTDIVSKKGKYYISGAAGSGKSTLLRSHMHKLILDFESKKSTKIPILIRIKNIMHYKSVDIEQVITSYLCDEYSLSKEETANIFSKKSDLIFFLDGFDELSNETERDFFNDILHILEDEYNSSIFVTSRKMGLMITEHFNSYSKWELADFSIKQIANFFTKWFIEKNDRLLDDLKDHDLLDKLPNTPLVMTLIAILFESDDNVEIPANLSELYRMFVDLLLGRWNLDRKIDSFYKANDKETFLTEIALYLHYNNKTACSSEELFHIFEKTEATLGRLFDYNRLRDELIKDTNLLVINENTEFEFRHLSFQEYFVGVYLTINNNLEDIISNFPQPWWDQVLYFYCGTRKVNDDILPIIYKRLLDCDTKQKLLGLFQLGYLIQSSYKTSATIRSDLITNSIILYSSSISEFISNIETTGKKVPEVIHYLSLTEIFKMHYSSKYLSQIYCSIYQKIRESNIDSFEKALALFIIATILANDGCIEVLSDCDNIFKDYPILLLMEDFLIRCELLGDIKEKNQLLQIKERSRVISKRIKHNRELYKTLLE